MLLFKSDMDAFECFYTFLSGFKDVLLNQAGLYESLRALAAGRFAMKKHIMTLIMTP